MNKKNLLISGIGAVASAVCGGFFIRGIKNKSYLQGFADGAITIAQINEQQKELEQKKCKGFLGLFKS